VQRCIEHRLAFLAPVWVDVDNHPTALDPLSLGLLVDLFRSLFLRGFLSRTPLVALCPSSSLEACVLEMLFVEKRIWLRVYLCKPFSPLRPIRCEVCSNKLIRYRNVL